MENKFVKLIENNNWSDYTFILTSVCVGNVGQLATDLLISSLPNTQKAGYLISSLVQPIVGYNTNRFELSLSVELYENKPLKLVIMQQRAPIFKGKQADFAELLVDFIKREGFKEVICLTSSHAYERLDSQIMGTQTRFLSTNDEIKKSLEANLKWKGLEKRTSTESKPLGYFIPGGGISQKFFKKCEEQKLNVVVLIIFAHEGNNIPESIQLVNYLNEWKEFLPKSQLKGEKEGSALKEPKKQRVVDENRLDWKYTEKERYQRLFGSMSKLAVSKQ